jgi:hypothetical protein
MKTKRLEVRSTLHDRNTTLQLLPGLKVHSFAMMEVINQSP